MALRPNRPAWSSLSRQTIRAYSGPLARHPTALREKHDPLNRDPSEADLEDAKPRWAYTPEGMIGAHGFSLNKIKVPSRAIWHVNEDPTKLDDFYERFLGLHGQRMLPEEVKWLAVTHKSFDYGRRGFNTRLAYFGRRAHHRPKPETATSAEKKKKREVSGYKLTVVSSQQADKL